MSESAATDKTGLAAPAKGGERPGKVTGVTGNGGARPPAAPNGAAGATSAVAGRTGGAAAIRFASHDAFALRAATRVASSSLACFARLRSSSCLRARRVALRMVPRWHGSIQVVASGLPDG